MPMFGTLSRNRLLCCCGLGGLSLTVEQARAIVPRPVRTRSTDGDEDVDALLRERRQIGYRSFHTNEEWLSADQLAGRLQDARATIHGPGLDHSRHPDARRRPDLGPGRRDGQPTGES